MIAGATRIASLPMYDLPELARATDALWAAIAASLERAGIGGVPGALARDQPFGREWSEPDLLLSQTCGYVLTHALSGRVQLVATPSYRAPGCLGPRYRSFVVVARASRFERLDDLRGRIAGINSDDSHSGMNALRHAFAPLAHDGRFFARVERTGSHRNSIAQVASGAIDVAAIDCVTFALLERVAPALTGAVRVIEETPAVPGLPLITSGTSEVEPDVMRRALNSAWAAVDAEIKTALWLDDIEIVPLGDYAVIDAMEAEAVQRGFPELA